MTREINHVIGGKQVAGRIRLGSSNTVRDRQGSHGVCVEEAIDRGFVDARFEHAGVELREDMAVAPSAIFLQVVLVTHVLR